MITGRRGHRIGCTIVWCGLSKNPTVMSVICISTPIAWPIDGTSCAVTEYGEIKRELTQVSSLFSVVFYRTITSVPAVMRTMPTALFQVNGSWNRRKASTSVMTTLSLSMGTTLVTSPNCSAL